MKNLNTIEDKVKAILTRNEKARDDDMTLYACVCRSCLPDVAKLPFETVLLHYRSLGIPNLESVGRIRRKLQAQHPELASSPEVRKRRQAQEQVYRNYSKQ